jgi:hypothetical protein
VFVFDEKTLTIGAAKHLFTASALGLFAQLGGGPLPLAQLAERCGIPARSARILADAMVALGFLDKADAGYANRPAARSFLAGDPGEGLRPFLSFWDQISYPAWMSLEDAARTGTGVGLQLTEAQQQRLGKGPARPPSPGAPGRPPDCRRKLNTCRRH